MLQVAGGEDSIKYKEEDEVAAVIGKGDCHCHHPNLRGSYRMFRVELVHKFSIERVVGAGDSWQIKK